MSDLIDQIIYHIDALCDPRQHTEPRYEWTASRHRKPLPAHRTTVPGLIQQLRDLAAELTAVGNNGTRTVPSSSPPGMWDAVGLLASISHGAARRVTALNIKIRDTPEGNLRALTGELKQTEGTSLKELRDELKAWCGQAEVICGWRAPAIPLPAPCPVCEAHGKLLARADNSMASAWCINCGSGWDTATVGVLERHVSAYRSHADEQARRARVRAADERRRQLEARLPTV